MKNNFLFSIYVLLKNFLEFLNQDSFKSLNKKCDNVKWLSIYLFIYFICLGKKGESDINRLNILNQTN